MWALRPESTTGPLWLALQFPHLSLDLASRGDHRYRGQALAISDRGRRGQHILDCNPTAERAGIRPGMPVNAALGLAEGLCLCPRDAGAEHAAIERLASWCYQYSSRVALLPGRHALVLETGASQRLFGSSEALAQRMSDELLHMGYHVRSGSAPTPEAAQMAARHGLHLSCTTKLQRQLGRLPLDSLYLAPEQLSALRKMGFTTVAEIFRLPRKALARRMGPATADYLDRLSGSRPEALESWRPPECFSAALDLVSEASGSQALLFPLKRLVVELCGVLRAADRGIQALHIRLQFDRGEDRQASLRLGMQQVTRSEARILLLLRERLERLRLPAPVCRIRLEASQFLPFEIRPDSLFREDPDCTTQAVGPLLERLQARLGSGAVHGLRGVEDHRPEYSWALREPGEPAHCTGMPQRPVWLFAKPQRCRIEDYRVLAGPERIEAGWWDGHDCRRDYFVVRDRKGGTLWAFREYKPQPGWYLQGMFS